MLGLLLLLLGLGLIFLLQNRGTVLIYFLGNRSADALVSLQLPLGVWVVIFVLAGILTSLLVQLLIRFSRPSISKTKAPRREPRPSPTPPRAPQPPPTSPITGDRRWQWENPIPEVDDWEESEVIPSPEPRPQPQEPVIPPPIVEPKVEPKNEAPSQEPLPPLQLKQFEVSRSPQKSERQGTIYSQTYREADQAASPRTKQPAKPSNTDADIYDANFRVLRPPLTAGQEPDEDDEDWV